MSLPCYNTHSCQRAITCNNHTVVYVLLHHEQIMEAKEHILSSLAAAKAKGRDVQVIGVIDVASNGGKKVSQTS